MSFKLVTSFPILFLLLISLSSAKVLPNSTTLFLPVTKDSLTLQYTTILGQRTPLVPIKLTFHLGGLSLWVDCERGYNSSTYKPARCGSEQCTIGKSHACGDCIFKNQTQIGCNNDACYMWGDNPIIDSFMDRAEITEDVLAIGSTPGLLVTRPQFIFGCLLHDESGLFKGLVNGVTGIAGFGHLSNVSIPNQLALDSTIARKFAICLSSSTRSTGVIFIGSGPYYIYNPKIDFSKNLEYTPLITNKKAGLNPSEYYVQVSSIRIAGKDVPLNKTLLSINKQGFAGTRISTTTPFTILDTSIYNAVKTAFIDALPKNVTIVEPPMKRFGFGVCFSSKNIRSTNLGPDVPVIDFVLQNKKSFWRIYGANSMVQFKNDVMCLAFVGQDQTWKPSIVIGGHQLEDNLLEFDLTKKKIGFSSSLKLQKTSCAKYDYTSKN